MSATRPTQLLRFRKHQGTAARDLVVEEEPLELQIQGASVAVLMRTPGHDEELALGFLVTERVVSSREEVHSLEHCTVVPDPEADENVMRVRLAGDPDIDLERLRRNLYASSSCGVCGKATIENALRTAPPLDDHTRFDAGMLYALPDKLRSSQEVFEQTGGLHAAGLFTPEGELVVLREDVGRHNAVDKVVGACLLEGRPLGGHALLVSGRVSFEIVQKAAAARIPLVAGISAPSSLAVRLAHALEVTLVGFLREDSMNVYAGERRLVGAA